MATLEIEGPDSGWLASVGFDDEGEVRTLESSPDWHGEILRLVARLLQEPAPSGRIPGEHMQPFDEDLLYDLAEALRRRRPLCRGERIMGYVANGSRYIETPDESDA